MTKETPYFRPRNWHKFQSRSNNSMAWVKTHTALLQDPDYLNLTPLQRAVLHGVWLLCGVCGRPLPLVSSYCGRALAMRSQDCGRALEVLLSSDFIELCDPTENLHSELPRLEEKREDKRRKKEPPLPPKGKSEIDDPIFENEFWPNHPRQRRGNKQQAWRAWKRALGRSSSGEIIAGHRAYCDSDEVRRGFAKGAAAWLNDDRWKHDYRTFHTKTNDELREEFIHGDQGNDLGHDILDGQCVDISGQGSEDDGQRVLSGPAGSERRRSNGRGNGSAVELGQGSAAQACGHQDTGRRVADLIAETAKAAKAPTKP